MRNTFRVLLVLLLAVSLAAGPVANACCDGFWSCAAAVVTGGLSCAIEDLINSINSMIHNIETIVNSIHRNVGEVTGAAFDAIQAAGNGLRNLVHAAESDVADAARRAEAIVAAAERPAVALVRPPLGAVASQVKGGVTAPAPAAAGGAPLGNTMLVPPAMQAPCEPAAILDALRRAKAEVLSEKGRIAEAAETVRKGARTAEDQVRAKFDFAARMAQDTLLGPLTDLAGMLGDLVRHPDRLFDPTALVNDALTRVTNRIAQTMNDMTDELVRDARATLDLAQAPTHLALDGAKSAMHLADAMDALEKQKTKAACDRLNALLPRPNVTLVVHMAAVSPALDFASHRALTTDALAKIGTAKTRSITISGNLASSLNRDWSVLKTRQQALSHPTLPPGAAVSLKQHEDDMFRGLSKSQVQNKKNELVAEARRRFANDPKTLAKLLEYLNRTVDARVKLAPAAAIR
jgi:hypothetical protein